MADKPKDKDGSILEELTEFSGPNIFEQIVAKKHGVSIDRVRQETIDGQTYMTVDGVKVGKVDWVVEPEDLLAQQFELSGDDNDEETKH